MEPGRPVEATKFKYEAFISYSHSDRTWADWLHRAIETYRVPKRLLVEHPDLPKRLTPIFRDREELATAVDLGQKIEEALSTSKRLIVLCSPRSAASRWVNEEIRRFKSLGRADQIFAIIIDGEPNAVARSRDPALECFPEQMRYDDVGVEQDRIAADLRRSGDGRHNAQLKLIAGMLGVGLDDLRRREQQRRQRRLVAVTAASVAGLIVTTTLAAFALVARRDAEREAQTSRRTTDFMVQLFDVVDPDEARGRSVTAYEILDRGVDQIHQLNDAPEVQATLLATMGKVFTGLGLYDKAERLLNDAMTTQTRAHSETSVATRVALAEVQYLAGKYDAAEAQYRDAMDLLPSTEWDAVHADAYNGLAEVLTRKGADEEAMHLYEVALEGDQKAWDHANPQTARTLNGIAILELNADRLESAQTNFEKALEAYRLSLGDDHPQVAEAINNLGAVHYFSGDIAGAAGYYERALPLYRKVYGEGHPEVALILNNLARMDIELGQAGAARPLLEESVSIDRGLGRSGHDDFVFGLANLAIVVKSQGDLARAELLLDEARSLAARIDHRLLAPILVDLADLYCQTNRIQQGIDVLRDAAVKMQQRYPDEQWRMALLDSVEGGCLSTAGATDQAEPKLIDSYSVIAARWGDAGLFTRTARSRIADHYERVGKPDLAQRYRSPPRT